MVTVMKTTRQIRIGAILSYVSMAVGYVVQIVYTPLMLRIIGSNQYGVYNLTNSIVSYLSLFSLGFAPAYVRFFMRHKVRNDSEGVIKLNGLFMSAFLILGLLALLSGGIMVSNIGGLLGSKFSIAELKLAKILMILMVVNIGISFPLIPIVSFIQANERFIFQNGLNIVRQICSPFLSLPLLLAGYGAIGMTAATTAISIGISVCQFWYAVRVLHFKITFKNLEFDEFKEVSIFSSFIFLNAVTDQINWNADKFIVGRYSGALAVAIYGIAAQLNSYYLGFSTAISNVFIPKINNIVADYGIDKNEKLNSIFVTVGKMQLIVVGLILTNIIVVGKEFIFFWAGKDYLAAYPLLLVMVIPVTIPLIQNTGITIQQAMNKHIFRSIVYFLIALLNIVASISLVGRIGSIGAAAATAGSLIIGNGFLMNWYYEKHIGLNVFKFWRKMSGPILTIIIVCPVGVLIKRFVNAYSFVGFVIVAVITSLIYLVLIWIIGLTNHEREMLKSRYLHV